MRQAAVEALERLDARDQAEALRARLDDAEECRWGDDDAADRPATTIGALAAQILRRWELER